MFNKPLFKIKYYLSHISFFMLNKNILEEDSKKLPSPNYLNHVSWFLKEDNKNF